MIFSELTIDELRDKANWCRSYLPFADIEKCKEKEKEMIDEGENLQNIISYLALIEKQIKKLEAEGTGSSSCCYEQKEITK